MNGVKKKYRRFLWCCLTASLMGMGVLVYDTARDSIPDELMIFPDEQPDWETILDNPAVTYDPAVEVSQNGSYRMQCSLFGMIPLKTIKVTSVEPQMVFASGSPVGIYMETEGVLVIDSGEIRGMDGIMQSPAEHIVQPGDYIRKVDGEILESKKQLMKLVEKNQGEPMEMEVMRKDELIDLALTPLQTEDGSYKLGIWVRDNIQGIGTLTYVDQKGTFAALGHGISDVDTGERLDISQGDLYDARICICQKRNFRKSGGIEGRDRLSGKLENGRNCKEHTQWDFGRCARKRKRKLSRQPYEISLKQDLKTGPAYILCDVGEGVQKYEIEITKIDQNAKDSNKSFVIHVTDTKLLELTGGIVQGMSGSPIIQEEKLVGAVTHVFVNDPTKGYGIFIENMMEH